MSMQPISYLSRLAEGGGNRRFLTPPRVLFRPVLPANPGLSEIESVIGSSQSPTATPTADRTVSMKSSQTASTRVQDSSASALQPVVLSTTPQLLMTQTPAQVPLLPDEAPNVMQVKQSLHHATDTESAIMRPTRSIGPQPRRTNLLNLEPAPFPTGIVNEVNRPSTRAARASALDSIIDKTMDTEQTGIAPNQPVVPRREPQRQATVIEDGGRVAASIQEDARKKQRSSMSSGRETGHSRRIFLMPSSVLAPSERSTHRAEKREKAGPDSSPAIHIGTLEVRISPPEMPQRTVPKKSSVLHPISPLAQGFRSFGLAQG
jgi:hypothetical protein